MPSPTGTGPIAGKAAVTPCPTPTDTNADWGQPLPGLTQVDFIDVSSDSSRDHLFRLQTRGYLVDMFDKSATTSADVQLSQPESGISLRFTLVGGVTRRQRRHAAGQAQAGPVTVTWTSYADRLKEDLELAHAVDGNAVSFRVQQHGLHFVQDGSGGYLAQDAAGKTRFHVLAPTAQDAAGHSGNVSLALDDSSAVVRLDPGFARTAIYPIQIDPPVIYAYQDSSPASGWTGSYFANTSFSGDPVLVRSDPTINFDWAGQQPDPSVPASNFSVRWTAGVTFDGSPQWFHMRWDDNMRVLIDGQIVVNHWGCCGETFDQVTPPSGTHTLSVEYAQGGGNSYAVFGYFPVPAVPSDTWYAVYWPNTNLSGSAAMIRNDSDINFTWAGNNPGPNTPGTNFSVRWTRQFAFDGTPQWFHTKRDDNIRVLIDGQVYVDHWGCCGETYDQVTPPAGTHTVTVEYLQGGGDAYAYFDFSPVPPTPTDGWYGVYWPNTSLSGSAAMLRVDPNINFAWGGNSPGPNTPGSNFSVRWTRQFTFDGTPQWFHTKRDDNIRVLIDGQTVVDHWGCCGETYDQVTPPSGTHTVTVEYAQGGGNAYADFDFFPVPPVPSNDWYGVYYPNTSLSGSASMLRVDPNINFSWGGASPGPNTPGTNFSVRWTRQVTFDGSSQQFHTRWDDNLRVRVDGMLLIDHWGCCGDTYDQVTPPAGTHTVTVEYAQGGGDAYALVQAPSLENGASSLPTGTVSTSAYATDITVPLLLSAGAPLGASVTSVHVWGDGLDTGWIPYWLSFGSNGYEWTASSGQGPKQINVQFEDDYLQLSQVVQTSTIFCPAGGVTSGGGLWPGWVWSPQGPCPIPTSATPTPTPAPTQVPATLPCPASPASTPILTLPSSGTPVQLRSAASDGGSQQCHVNADLNPGASYRNWHIIWNQSTLTFIAAPGVNDTWGPAPPIEFDDASTEASVVIGSLSSNSADIGEMTNMTAVLTEFLQDLAQRQP